MLRKDDAVRVATVAATATVSGATAGRNSMMVTDELNIDRRKKMKMTSSLVTPEVLSFPGFSGHSGVSEIKPLKPLEIRLPLLKPS
jgi:hypothetical protein